jgi:ribosome-associated protein
MHDETDHDDEEFDFVSKSQIKRELQLAELNDEQLAKLPLGNKTLAAVLESRNIKQHIARKRHLKHIGKLLREEDEGAIRQGLEVLLGQDKAATARFHRMEQWRDRLIAEGDGVLAEFIDNYPTADRQQLRQLIRNAQKEAAANKPPKSARQLFRLIRELVEAALRDGD